MPSARQRTPKRLLRFGRFQSLQLEQCPLGTCSVKIMRQILCQIPAGADTKQQITTL
ncbi:MAG: hypothetical protein O6768_04790 [Planctomycetota bacterium]|nr:hypothetical protein [Planctomycetota bacterium]